MGGRLKMHRRLDFREAYSDRAAIELYPALGLVAPAGVQGDGSVGCDLTLKRPSRKGSGRSPCGARAGASLLSSLGGSARVRVPGAC